MESQMDNSFIVMSFYNFDIDEKKDINGLNYNSYNSITLSDNDFINIYYLPDDYIIPSLITTGSNNIESNEIYWNKNIVKNNIVIDKDRFINFTIKNYKNYLSIYKQFRYDTSRNIIYINGTQERNSSIIKNYLEYKFCLDKTKTILALCTQASLSLPFIIIQKNISEGYLAEIRNDCGLFPKRYTVKINIKDDNIQFYIVKYLRVFTLVKHTDQTLFYIKIKLSFDLNKDKYILMEVTQIPK